MTSSSACRLLAFFCTCFLSIWILNANAKNPIIPNKGVNDPHIRIFNDKAYLFASHDKSADNKGFIMEDWWLWSSDDLVNWELESVLKPEQTYIGKPFDQAWAADAAYKDGQFYWYFSEGNHQAGVVVGPTAKGPWKDPLNKPFLAGDLTPTHEYDISIFNENGDYYVIFGVWQYYIAKLNSDLITLAEDPKPIEIHNPIGPYGDGTTDDKPFVHKYKDTYYLSWGAFYATSKNLYGPYNYVDRVMKDHSFAPGFDSPTWPMGYFQGRHGSFFEWHNQWYFAYCDISKSANRYFRDTFISYVHYRDDGTIAPIRVDGIGVGEYDADMGPIQAEDYFKSRGFSKVDMGNDEFSVKAYTLENALEFQYIRGLSDKKYLTIVAHSETATPFSISVYKDGTDGIKLANDAFKTKTNHKKKTYRIKLPKLSDSETLTLVLSSTDVMLDSIEFK